MYVETRGLTKRYPRVTALADLTLSVERGEVFGLLGPNGSGKSTLIRLLLGFLRSTAGAAKIDGLDCHSQSLAVRQRVAYLPGDVRLFGGLSGRGILEFFAQVREDGDLSRALGMARRLDLDLTRRVSSMSTGMRQKLALAAALSARSPLVILDEPTSNLDPSVRSEVAVMVREAREEGRTVMFSSHVLAEVEEVCDRVAILRTGKLVHLQCMRDLRRRHRVRAKLAGSLPEPPPAVRDLITVQQAPAGGTCIDTQGDLAPILGWLASLPLYELTIEPVGLRSVYDLHHQASRG